MNFLLSVRDFLEVIYPSVSTTAIQWNLLYITRFIIRIVCNILSWAWDILRLQISHNSYLIDILIYQSCSYDILVSTSFHLELSFGITSMICSYTLRTFSLNAVLYVFVSVRMSLCTSCLSSLWILLQSDAF